MSKILNSHIQRENDYPKVDICVLLALEVKLINLIMD